MDNNKEKETVATPSEAGSDATKKEITKDAQGLFQNIKTFLFELLDFRNDTDQEATIEAIKQDISFKGATAWILICSIFVASIGLNANSTAVVIGAMLISPLMGPILGIGMSLAINDIDTLRKSLINLVIMIVLSLLTAFTFFYLFPLSEDTSELLGRVRPDIRDVLIAFFGGLALIIARTKKGTIASVIFGVAIATALMPPLCTAGYGLAKGNLIYFLQALYLFTINTIFIALATFLVLKLLRFTMIRYVNSAKRKRTAQLASLVALVVMIPAFLTFMQVYRENGINTQLAEFLRNEIKLNPSYQLLDDSFTMETKELQLSFFNEISEGEVNSLKNSLMTDPRYSNLKDIKLSIKGSNTKSFDLISSAYTDAREELEQNKNIISGLNKEIEDLKQTISSLNQRIDKTEKDKNAQYIPFSTVAKDAKIRYNDILEISFSKVLSTKDFIKVDTMPEMSINWSKKLSETDRKKKQKELQLWLQKELKLDTLLIK